MGGQSSIIVGNATIDLNDYKCSDRGLILPSKQTVPMRFPLRAGSTFNLKFIKIYIF
jgi:hypothetical protein